MKKNLTELVFILDKSGSMAGLEADVVGGFNAMIEKQKKAEGDALISTVVFANDATVVHNRVNMQRVHHMNADKYWVGGGTALLDAIGGAIRHIRKVHQYIGDEYVPEHTIFVIMTDGMENASRRYSAPEVKHMIRRLQEKCGWDFIFLGANIDAVETADAFGIRRDRAVNYHSDAKGTQLNYEVIGDAICDVRAHGEMPKNWRERIDRDFLERK